MGIHKELNSLITTGMLREKKLEMDAWRETLK